MNDRHEPRDPVEELLSREPYLDDAGFTDRVLARLPARRDPRPLVLGLAVATAAALAAAVLPDLWRLLLAGLHAAPAALGLPPALALAAVALAGAALLAAGLLAWTD